MANTVINTPELLNLDSTTGATILAKGTISQRPPTPTFSIDYLVVAGGGGGGGGVTSESPGAGGAGAVIYQVAGLNVIPSSEYTLYIANGGAGGGNNSQGGNGQDSYISFGGSNVVLAKGGGGGGSYSGPGLDGGSGGGGTRDGDTNSSQAGGSAVTTNIAPAGASIYGNNGASGTGTGGCSGGGGGAGEAGNTDGEGTGGDGVQINIDGNNYYWGGGGGACGSVGTGGQGGGGGGPRGGQGGTGGINPGVSTGSSADGGGNGGANTGGGGGGGTNPTGYPGGTGGSGIIILRYPNTFTLVVGSGSLTTGQLNTVVGTDEKYTSFTGGTGTISFSGTVVGGDNDATDGTLRFNTDTNKTEYFDGTGWYEIVDEYASGFIGPATNYFDTKLYTGNGATQSIGGYINGSASFNGSSSYISGTVGATATTSFSMWIKINDTSSSQFIQVFDNNNFAIFIYNGKLNIQYASGSNSNGVAWTISNASNWNHIAGTFTSSSSTLYVNKVQKTESMNNWVNAESVPYIGNRNALDGYFDGEIDQVRIYNTTLSGTDVTALYDETAATATTAAFPSGQTAIATYTMDTSANGLLTTTDLSTVNYPAGAGCIALYEMNGNSNDTSETYNGTPTNITYQGGAFDQAAVFNGSSSRIQIASTSTDPVNISTGTFSVSMWVNMDNLTNNNKLVYKWGTTAANRNFLFTVLSSSGYLYFIEGTTGGDVLRVGTFALSINTWHHIALTREQGGSLKMYVDGDLKDTFSATGIFKTSSEPIYLGYQVGQTTNFTGSIDQVRIFNTALTQAQVTTLARGVATSYSGTATNVNFNGHLDFAPDLVWVKNRDESSYHYLYNTVSQGNLYSDSPAAQDANSVASYGTISPTSNGFGVTRGSNSSSNGLNKNSNDYVSWSWKAGGTAAAGTGTGVTNVSVSVNKDSGFSIVKYTGGNGASDTVNHGLTDSEMIILKDLTDGTNQWRVWHKDLTSGYWLYLNLANAQANAAVDGGIRNVNSNSFGFINGTTGGVEAVNSSASNYIAYVWKSISGYSKIGSYEGLGTSTVTVSDVGFKPSFIMIKNINVTANWNMYDLKRSTVADRANKILYPNLANSEPSVTNYYFDMNDSGFVVSATNHEQINFANRTYIYMTFA